MLWDGVQHEKITRLLHSSARIATLRGRQGTRRTAGRGGRGGGDEGGARARHEPARRAAGGRCATSPWSVPAGRSAGKIPRPGSALGCIRTSLSSMVTRMLCSQRARRLFGEPHTVWRCTQMLTNTCSAPSTKECRTVRKAEPCACTDAPVSSRS